jgi:AbrB family looped-hinge helix DNA binding protein
LASIKTEISIKSIPVILQISMTTSEVRKVQALQGERSLTVVLPKEFATKLGITKGDYLKVVIENKRIVLERAEL